METSYYERLSAQDSSFVRFDAGRGLLTIGAVAVFEPQATGSDALDIERFRNHVASRLHLLPRYRQCLYETPFQGHPIWVDDQRFDLTHHVRSCAVSAPGDDEQLKALAGMIASRPLDLARPLWELWLVEGLADRRYAVIAKIHHCLMDGVTGVGMLKVLLSPDANPFETPEAAAHWKPRKRPDLLHFLGDGLVKAASLSGDVFHNVASALSRPAKTAEDAMALAHSGLLTLAGGVTPPPETPLNQAIGGQRRIEWRELDLEIVKNLKRRLDGTVNDVILSVVAGAARHFFDHRSLAVADLDLRVIVPVDTRSGIPEETSGNQVSSWFLDLPVSEESALERFGKVKAQTTERKVRRAEIPIDQFLRFADWSGSSRLPFWGVRLVQALRPYNLIVTNVQGPTIPLYLMGSRLAAVYPTVPLFEGQGLTVAVMSYQDRIHYGLQGDWDLVPDLSKFAEGLDVALKELSAAVEQKPAVSAFAKKPSAKKASTPRPKKPPVPRLPRDSTNWRPLLAEKEGSHGRARRPDQTLIMDLLLGDPPSSTKRASKTKKSEAIQLETRIRAKGPRKATSSPTPSPSRPQLNPSD